MSTVGLPLVRTNFEQSKHSSCLCRFTVRDFASSSKLLGHYFCRFTVRISENKYAPCYQDHPLGFICRGIGSRPAFRRRRDLCGPRRLRRCIYERSQQELRDLREETLAGLSWLHLNHEDVASALRRTAVLHQQLLASALGLVYTAHSGKPQWPTMPSRAIAARAVPGDSASDIPTKRCHCQLPRWRGRRPHRPDLRPAAP